MDEHGIKIYTPPTPKNTPKFIKELIVWLNSKEADDLHSIIICAILHHRLVSVHPFSDGNGRISRLMMNFVLNKNKMPMLDIDYSNRDSYYTALERSQVKKNELIFLQWSFKKYFKENKTFV